MNLTLLMTTVALRGLPEQAGGPDPVDRYVRAFIERHRIPSVAVAIVRNDKVTKAAGYGWASLEPPAPAGPHTVYEIGSITKQFTAEAVLMLADEGKLSLDAPVSRYLANLPSAWEAITLRQLLTHTSGLPDWEGRAMLDFHREYTPAEFIQLIAGRPLDFAPGEQWSYTNSAYPLLGLVIEAVVGTPYERFVTERILGPAGMGESRFRNPRDVVPNRAAGYVDSAGGFRNGEPLRPRLLAPNGGILSTAADMGKWGVALGRGTIVPRARFEEMTTPVRLNDGRRFSAGIAWFVDGFRGHRFVLHNGSTAAGFSSVVYWYPEDRLFIVVLMNIDRGALVNQLATGIAGLAIPGLTIQTLPEHRDPDPEMTRRFLTLLADVANKRDNDFLAAELRNPPGPPRTSSSEGFGGVVDRFGFLDREDLGPGGVQRFGLLVRWIFRYKLVSGAQVRYYTFELTADGKVARLRAEDRW